MTNDHPASQIERPFWSKAQRHVKRAGREVLEKSLWLFFALQKDTTPRWARVAILGALAYFISPIDAIPDFIPVAGFTDDLGVLAAAAATVAAHVDAQVKARAAKKLAEWGVS